MAFLHPTDSQRHATVVTLEPTLFLEINSAALELSSDEVRERFNKVLLVKVLGRLREANKVLAKLGQTAVQGSFASSSRKRIDAAAGVAVIPVHGDQLPAHVAGKPGDFGSWVRETPSKCATIAG
jgi:hypothetical protein